MPERERGANLPALPALSLSVRRPQLRFQTSQVSYSSFYSSFHLTASSNKYTVNPVHRQKKIATARTATRTLESPAGYSTNVSAALAPPALPTGERSSPPRPSAADVGGAPPSWRTPANGTRTPKSSRQNWTDMCGCADLIQVNTSPISSRNPSLHSLQSAVQR